MTTRLLPLEPLPDPFMLFEADPFWDSDAVRAMQVCCAVCGADCGVPCFDEPAQGLPGFHHARLADGQCV